MSFSESNISTIDADDMNIDVDRFFKNLELEQTNIKLSLNYNPKEFFFLKTLLLKIFFFPKSKSSTEKSASEPK